MYKSQMPNISGRHHGICVCKNSSVSSQNTITRDVRRIPVAQKQSVSMCFSIKRKANENSRVNSLHSLLGFDSFVNYFLSVWITLLQKYYANW